jgi:hypothetical protein
MSRVYLFALMPGGKRPAVVSVSASEADFRAKNPTFPGAYRFPYWLIECESAEAGRRLIEAFRHEPNGDEWAVRMQSAMHRDSGRILSSGGAA